MARPGTSLLPDCYLGPDRALGLVEQFAPSTEIPPRVNFLAIDQMNRVRLQRQGSWAKGEKNDRHDNAYRRQRDSGAVVGVVQAGSISTQDKKKRLRLEAAMKVWCLLNQPPRLGGDLPLALFYLLCVGASVLAAVSF